MSRTIAKGDRVPYWIALTIDWVVFTATLGHCQAKSVDNLLHYISRRDIRRKLWKEWQ